MEFAKLSAPSLKDLFVQQLQGMILSDELPMGTQLPPERELAQQMQVSRAVVNGGLAELAQRMGKSAFLIDDAKDIQEEGVKEVKCVGVTAGASAPDILVQNVVARLQQLGGGEAITLEGREENIVFEVPKELRVDIREVD